MLTLFCIRLSNGTLKAARCNCNRCSHKMVQSKTRWKKRKRARNEMVRHTTHCMIVSSPLPALHCYWTTMGRRMTNRATGYAKEEPCDRLRDWKKELVCYSMTVQHSPAAEVLVLTMSQSGDSRQANPSSKASLSLRPWIVVLPTLDEVPN